eukprot:TRINITY_DN2072_c0_g1_i2.p1 TRINITY_DN2072_c0_g1~~TRINITY_DN2072_c0_g1_i2.p1  ORF type:complete len:408 (-),score=141.41 TRINITY_DN2072_c0_g1_i2:100-1323(-)
MIDWADDDDFGSASALPVAAGSALPVAAAPAVPVQEPTHPAAQQAPHAERPSHFGGRREDNQQRGRDSSYRSGKVGPPQGERKERERLPIPDAPPYVMFLGNLSFKITQEDIMSYFEALSPVGANLPTEDGRSKGIAYITFRERGDLEKALLIDGEELGGRVVNANVAAPRTSHWKGSGRDFGFRGGNKSTGPPSLNLKPRSEAPAAEASSPTKVKSEDPFGGASNNDKALEMRLKKEAERAKQVLEQSAKREQEKKEREKQEQEKREREEKEKNEKKLAEQKDGWSEGKGKKSAPTTPVSASSTQNWRNNANKDGKSPVRKMAWGHDDRGANKDTQRKPQGAHQGHQGRGGKAQGQGRPQQQQKTEAKADASSATRKPFSYAAAASTTAATPTKNPFDALSEGGSN